MKKSKDSPGKTVSLPRPLTGQSLAALPAKEALEVILDSPLPATLVQSLPEEDLFWMVRDLGPEDALPVLALASNEQWQFVLDLELWKKDRLDTEAVHRWFELLEGADAERFLIWGLRDNLDLLEYHLFRSIDVRIREEDESPSDFDDGYFSFDGTFYVRAKDEGHADQIRGFLHRLTEHDLDRSRDVLLEISSVLPAETEEHLYRLRNVRLAEKGFFPVEEAVGIYRYLAPSDLSEKRMVHEEPLTEPDRYPPPVPFSITAFAQDKGLFFEALQQISEPRLLDRIWADFSVACNQVIAADGTLPQERRGLAAVVKKVRGYLDIALEKLAGGDPTRASAYVKNFPVKEIFRVGFGSALELKWRAQRWLKASWFVRQGVGLSFWEEGGEAMLAGVLKKRPLYYTAYREGEPYRDFARLADIAHCEAALDEIAAMDELLARLFGDSVPMKGERTYQPLTYKSLLLTCWACRFLDLPGGIRPLGEAQMRLLFQSLWQSGEKPYRIGREIRTGFLDWLAAQSRLPITEFAGEAGAAVEKLFNELEQEYGGVSIEDLDPRYVRHFLITL